MGRRNQFSNIEELFLTIANGNLTGLQNYLTNGGNVNIKDGTQSTLLHQAVKEGNIDKVKLLIGNGCSLSAADSNGCTPVYEAVESGCHNILEHLLESGAGVNAYVDHSTPLMVAVMKEDLVSLKLLVDIIPESDIKDENYVGQSALTQAVITNNVEICEILLQKGASLNCDYGKSFSKDIARKLCTNLEMMKTFLKYRQPKNLRFLLMFACSYNLIDAAKIILLRHETPFHLEALGFLTQKEEESIWTDLVQTVVRSYKNATKCSEDNKLLEMLLSFCQHQSYDKTLHKSRAKSLIRILIKYGLVIYPMAPIKSCDRNCECRSIMFTALYDQPAVTSLKAQCCSVIRQTLHGDMFFDLSDVSLLPIPKLLQDFICMKEW